MLRFDPVLAFAFASLLAIAACSAGTAPSFTPEPLGRVPLDRLLTNPAAADGRVVTLVGAYYEDAAGPRLCDVLLESYPPQCPGGLPVRGDVPDDILAGLDTTADEPGLAKVTWGQVEVTGVVHAGDDGTWLEITEILLPVG